MTTIDAPFRAHLHAYLRTQLSTVEQADAPLRAGEDRSHPTRVAIRRVRSIVRVFAEVFEPAARQTLSDELAWFALRLGAVRDVAVIAQILDDERNDGGGATDPDGRDATHPDGPETAHPDGPETTDPDGPDATGLDPVHAAWRAIDEALRVRRSDAWRDLHETMTGARYAQLRATIRRWRDVPAFAEQVPAHRAHVAWYLDRSSKLLERRLLAAAVPDADPALRHAARKGAKRMRYAAEFAEPFIGKSARAMRTRGEVYQTTLGASQDAVVAADFLDDVAGDRGLSDEARMVIATMAIRVLREGLAP